MPAKHTLHVVLNASLARYVREKVAAGHHPTASEVVRHSLYGLMQRDDLDSLKVEVSKRLSQAPHG